MKKVTFVFAVVLLGITSVVAQESKTEKTQKGKLYVLAGVQYIKLSNINKVLKNNSLPEIGKFHSYYGYGGSWQSGKWTFGGEGYHTNSGEDNDDDQSSKDIQISTNAGMGYFYVGYSIVAKEKFYITPRVGVGGGGINVQIDHKAETTLNDLFTNNYSNNLKTSGALVHSGVKFGFILGTNWDFNFDIGYNHGFANKWNAANGKLTESVKDGIGGAFAQITMGYTLRNPFRTKEL